MDKQINQKQKPQGVKLDGTRPVRKYQRKGVDNDIKAVGEALKKERAKTESNPITLLADEAKFAKMKNDAEIAIDKEYIRTLYKDELARLMHLDVSMTISGKEREFSLHEAEDKAAVHTAQTIILKSQTDLSAVRLLKYLADIKEDVGKELAVPRANIEKKTVAIEEHKVEQEHARVGYSEATKTTEVYTQYEIKDDVAEAKKATAVIEKVKLQKQLAETALQKAPIDDYQLESSEDFDFKLKEAKFQYDYRAFVLMLCMCLLTWLSAEFSLPGVVTLFFSLLTVNMAVFVVVQVVNPLMRYKSGSEYHYRSRRKYATVPGKGLFGEQDVRMENDRRDLVKYDGLVRFFDVTHIYVAPIRILTYQVPLLKIYKKKNTVIAVSVGLLQQVITKRVSFCDEENWVRSKIEYNMSNMTCINVDKELMFIPHPDSEKKHGFAVFQQTVDVAWGWIMSQKQMSKHVPRPRAVVSQPK